MKKLLVLLSLILSIALWSCSGDSGQGDKAAKTEKTKTKKLSLKTEEGMMKRLQEFGLKAPEFLKFVEVSKKSGEYSAIFAAENVDEATRKQLDDWYAKQLTDLEANGFKEMELGRRINEEMVGLVYNTRYFKKPRGGSSTLSDIISLTSVYDAEKNTYKLYLSPSKH